MDRDIKEVAEDVEHRGQGRGQIIMFGGLEPRAWLAREREPITGVWVRGQSPPEAENLLASRCATEAANSPHSVRTLTLSV